LIVNTPDAEAVPSLNTKDPDPVIPPVATQVPSPLQNVDELAPVPPLKRAIGTLPVVRSAALPEEAIGARLLTDVTAVLAVV
jgi:hypothetical protein